jgi:hypothetical protein
MLFALPFPLVAQPVGVQSGEHAGFTRLVLDIGRDREWRLEGEGRSRRLALSPPADGFAIDRVFELIPRTRLAALEEGAGLILSLACACTISASRYQGRYLVLDILDPDPLASQNPVEGEEARAVRRLAAAESLPDMTRLLAGTPVDAQAAARPASPPLTLADPATVDLEQAARIMAEQLARAAASGLLEANPGRPMSDADPRPAARPLIPPAPETELDEAHAGPPIRAETAIDAALNDATGTAPQGRRLTCAAAEPPIRDWSSGGGVGQGLGALRFALFDDRDRLQRDAAITLARHYLYYGFGAEAAYWLNQIDAPPLELLVIAGVVDGAPGPHFPSEADPTVCSEEGLLWRYLDRTLAQPPSADQAGRLQRATAALPLVLRDQLAPRVARALHGDGFVHEARNLRDMLRRGGRVSERVLVSLDRELGIEAADVAGMRDALTLALRDDGGDPVTVMAHALAFDRETGFPVSPGRLLAAEALLRENGPGEETAPLWQEVVLAQAAQGDIDRMLAALGEDAVPAVARDAALTAVFADRLAAEDTAALLLLARVFGAAWLAEGSEAGRVRVAAIAHLREAGLMEAAELLRAGQRMLILPARPVAAPDEAELVQVAWQIGDWAALRELADGPHQDIALRMAARATSAPAVPDPAALAGDLSAVMARLADSRALRDQISAVLATPAPGVQEVTR